MKINSNNNIPPCNIMIDKEGVWYYKGVEMFRKDIVSLFYQNLKKDEKGRYIIEFENDRCYLDVEDTPFVVKAVYRSVSKSGDSEAIHILLNDKTMEKLDPSSLWIEKDNILYCSVKDNKFYARFSRSSYYQIANYIKQNGEKDEYFTPLNGRHYYIKVGGNRS